MKKKLFKKSLADTKPEHLTEKDAFVLAVKVVVPERVNRVSKEQLKTDIKAVYELIVELAEEL